ncbi:MAG: hydantoinase B/oxoprolinase family protein [Leptospirales bacterium]|nr:hydantoinase B/oxoprolinase family protein [Leptospirales bacterium]
MSEAKGWRIWIDRGGTFTDFVALAPDNQLHCLKLPSVFPGRYADAALPGIRQLLGIPEEAPLPPEAISEIRVGTTIGTNALLERQGDRLALFTTAGFGDALSIGFQNRPDIFALEIQRTESLCLDCFEISERIGASGEILKPLDEASAGAAVQRALDAGYSHGLALFVHSWRNPEHELRFAQLAARLGFTSLTLSHQASAAMGFVRRGDTAAIDAYLQSPIAAYRNALQTALPRSPLSFLQSHGGLCAAEQFRGCDSLLSGPAGGVIGGAAVASERDLLPVIGFDMGGTSTDVWRYEGEYERIEESEISGLRLQRPMLWIHTVAAGGGSVVSFDGERLLAGPRSAGAEPGPAAYGRGGPATLSDANLLLGRLAAELVGKHFGQSGDQALQLESSRSAYSALADRIAEAGKQSMSVEQIAESALELANDQMANAIRRVCLARGFDAAQHTLLSFGGAGGQHCCQVAEALGIKQILCHPLAGALSALGAGLARNASIKEIVVDRLLDEDLAAELRRGFGNWVTEDGKEHRLRAFLSYDGGDQEISVELQSAGSMRIAFEAEHARRFGFTQDQRKLRLQRLQHESLEGARPPVPTSATPFDPIVLQAKIEADWQIYFKDAWLPAKRLQRENLKPGNVIQGPALIVSALDTVFLTPDWSGAVQEDGAMLLRMKRPKIDPGGGMLSTDMARRRQKGPRPANPAQLQLFVRRFQFIAEEMGAALQRSAVSVNIRERLDFSCAIFDADGELIANAPHIPVHLGSMADSVQSVIRIQGGVFRRGQAFAINAPYQGGTHLPDITVVAPIFVSGQLFAFVAARGHHADVGGISPGSMPASSRTIEEEGVLLNGLKIRDQGRWLEEDLRAALGAGPWPARNIEQNLGDLKAQLAACERGAAMLTDLAAREGSQLVQLRMKESIDAAERLALTALSGVLPGTSLIEIDEARRIAVSCRLDPQTRKMIFDFRGSSPMDAGNFNAPLPVVRAALMYVLRLASGHDAPLNAGFLRAFRMVLPEDCLLQPRPPAAVVAGNVEVSQAIVNAALLAMGLQAASQGTMNNLSFGDASLQYYETICGGAGAGPGYDGQSAVQTHMTNSRITDVEILEARFPVLVEEFSLRRGSGGAGKQRGGDGVIRRLRFLRRMQVSMLSSMRAKGPPGLHGGGSALPGENWLTTANGERSSLPASVERVFEPGETLEIRTPGGGGYGNGFNDRV